MDAVKKRLKNCRRSFIWLFSRLGAGLFAYGKESSPTVAISRNSGSRLTSIFRSHRFSTKTLFKPSAIVAHLGLAARSMGLFLRFPFYCISPFHTTIVAGAHTMFDRKQFQHKVYSMVTKEVHDACTELLKGDRKMLRLEAIQIQRQVIYAMNWVTEQTVLKIGNGLLLDKLD